MNPISLNSSNITCYSYTQPEPDKPAVLNEIAFKIAIENSHLKAERLPLVGKEVILFTDHPCTPDEIAAISKKINALKSEKLSPGVDGQNIQEQDKKVRFAQPEVTQLMEREEKRVDEQFSQLPSLNKALKNQLEVLVRDERRAQKVKWSSKEMSTPEFKSRLEDLEKNFLKGYQALQPEERENLQELSKLLTGVFNEALRDNESGQNNLGKLLKLTKLLEDYVSVPVLDSRFEPIQKKLMETVYQLEELPGLGDLDSSKILVLADSPSKSFPNFVKAYITEIYARFP